MLLDEFFHQILALSIIKYNNLYTAGFQIAFTTDEVYILPNDDPWDVVQKDGTGAHVTWAVQKQDESIDEVVRYIFKINKYLSVVYCSHTVRIANKSAKMKSSQ